MLKSGHKIVPVTGKEQKKLVEDFKIASVGTIRLEPGNWFYTSPFILFADKLYDFQFKPSDVVVMTFPKSGTTWMQEIIWTLKNNPDLNNPKAVLPIVERSIHVDSDFYLEGTHFPALDPENDPKEKFRRNFPQKNVKDGIALQTLETARDPRTIKTHLSFSLLNPKMLDICKVIYVARNPKDVVVSYHHLFKLFAAYGYDGTLDDTVDYFLNDAVLRGPYWQHIKDAWDRRYHPNLHFVYYEDLKENPKQEIIRIQKFLDIDLTNDQLNNVVQYTSFKEMKKRDNVYGQLTRNSDKENQFLNVNHMLGEGGFFRKGIVGDYKNRLTADQIKRIDDWTERNVLSFGQEFKYRKQNIF